jgi:mycobactin polyketide synthetase MbtD
MSETDVRVPEATAVPRSDYRLPDGSIPVLVSSHSADGLRTEAAQVSAYLWARPELGPEPVADMLLRTRAARRHRALVLAGSRDELLAALDAVATGAEHPSVVTGTAAQRRIGFVFPGQGSQRPGMGRLYYELSPHYRSEVDACATIHEQRWDHVRPLHYLLGEDGRYQDEVWEIQPALMFHMAGLAAMWQAVGVRPAATIGHSQGELAATWIAGVTSRRDSVLTVTHRARLVDRISPRGYSMAVLGMDRDSCEALLARHSGWAELAVINSPNILAISGDRNTVVDLVAAAAGQGRFARQIDVAYPAHTSIVAELRRELGSFLDDELDSVTFSAGEIPCYGATLGDRITPELIQEQYWYWNLRNRVRFDRAVAAAAADGIDTFVEVAEHPTLQLALQENLAAQPSNPTRPHQVLGTSLRTADSLREFTRNLAALAVSDLGYDWQALATGTRTWLPLPDFPHTVMGRQRFWLAPDTVPPARAADPAPTRRLTETWVRLDRRRLSPPRDLLVVDHTGRCTELAAAVCTAAHDYGGSGHEHGEGGTRAYDGVLILLPELPEIDPAAAVAEVAEFFGTPAWLPDLTGVRDCWLVTVGGAAVTSDDPAPHLFHGAVAAGYRCLGMERVGVSFRHLDLAPGQAAAAQAAAIVRAVHVCDEPELALRGNGTYAKRLVVDDEPAEPVAVAPPRHVVIIGGTGTLGIRFCEYYARRGAGRITLLSRTGATEEVERRLRRLPAETGSEIVIIACDVGDAAAVRHCATQQRVPADLIVHAAVNYVRAELAEVTADRVVAAAGAKIFGTDNIIRLWPRTADCRFVFCSSAAATFGGRGQILYATVNRMLDVLARRLRARGVDAVAIEWGLWDLAGPLHAVGVDPVHAAGVVGMPPEQALAVGLTAHADHPGAAERLVLAADWAQLRAMLSAVGFEPLIESVVAAEPAMPAELSPPPSLHQEFGTAESGTAESLTAQSRTAATVSEQVRRELAAVMGTADPAELDGSVPLVGLGLDSLQALDLRKRVQAALHRELPVAAVLGGASLDDVIHLLTGTGALPDDATIQEPDFDVR